MSREDTFTLKKWLWAVSLIWGANLVGMVSTQINDHYLTRATSEKVAIMEPRVNSLWYSQHPDVAKAGK